MMVDVNLMYKYCIENNIKLLSDFEADFWNEYLNEYEKFDKVFRRTYLSFRYFIQDGTETIEEITTDFIEDVYNHLLVNKKKYSELYRIYVIDDEDYSLLDNYNIKEIMDKDSTSNDNNLYGERNDSTTDVTGTQSTNSVEKVSPYDSNNFYNNTSVDGTMGSRTDNSSLIKGSQNDLLNNISTENYTLTRKGNIGVQTGTDMLNKHNSFWKTYEFYNIIFSEIAKQLLIV